MTKRYFTVESFNEDGTTTKFITDKTNDAVRVLLDNFSEGIHAQMTDEEGRVLVIVNKNEEGIDYLTIDWNKMVIRYLQSF